VFCPLLFAKDGRLLAGTGGGPQAKIYIIDSGGKAKVFHEPKGRRTSGRWPGESRAKIYAATATKGQLFKVEPDGSKSQVMADLKPKNLMCLAFGPDGPSCTQGPTRTALSAASTPPTAGLRHVRRQGTEISAIVFDKPG